MKVQLGVICLTLELIFYISTEVSGDGEDDDFRKRGRQHMITMAALRPTASEITIALSDSKVSGDIQVNNNLLLSEL